MQIIREYRLHNINGTVVFCCLQSEMAALEVKLAELRAKEQEILGHIGEEEGRIQAVHEELASEDGQLAEERRQVQTREEELAKEVVSPLESRPHSLPYFTVDARTH